MLLAATAVVTAAALVVYSYHLPGILVGVVGVAASVATASRIQRRVALVFVTLGFATALAFLSFALFLLDLAAHGGA